MCLALAHWHTCRTTGQLEGLSRNSDIGPLHPLRVCNPTGVQIWPRSGQNKTFGFHGVGATVSRAVLVQRARKHRDRSEQYGQHAGLLHAAAGSRDGGAGVHDAGRPASFSPRCVPLTLQRHAAHAASGIAALAQRPGRDVAALAQRPGHTAPYDAAVSSRRKAWRPTAMRATLCTRRRLTRLRPGLVQPGLLTTGARALERFCFLQTTVHMGCTRACEGEAEAVRHRAHLNSKLKAGKNMNMPRFLLLLPVCICSISRTRW